MTPPLQFGLYTDRGPTTCGGKPGSAASGDAAGAPEAAALRARVYRRVPTAHVAPYPGMSLLRQYVKGQEVLARCGRRVGRRRARVRCARVRARAPWPR